MKPLRSLCIVALIWLAGVVMLGHGFFPHHHHYNSAVCEREAEHDACELEIEEAVLRLGSDRGGSLQDGRCLGVPPVGLCPAGDVLAMLSWPPPSVRIVYASISVGHVMARCYGSWSLRAPPVVA